MSQGSKITPQLYCIVSYCIVSSAEQDKASSRPSSLSRWLISLTHTGGRGHWKDTKQETEEQGGINSAVLTNWEIVKVKVGFGRSGDGGA